MTESKDPQAPDFFAESRGDKADDGKGERDTEGHHFMSEFQSDNENPSQQEGDKQDGDTEGHHFMS